MIRQLPRRYQPHQLPLVQDGQHPHRVFPDKGIGLPQRRLRVAGYRRIHRQVPYLGFNGMDQRRRLQAEPLQHEPALLVWLSQPYRLMDLFRIQTVLQLGVPHRRGDGIGIRVAVSGYQYGHSLTPHFRASRAQSP